MRSDDSTRPQVFDLLAGLGLLTRLPVPVDGARAARRGAAAAWAWPVAGAAVGLLSAIAAALALALGTGAAIAAAVALGTQMMVTGALHEDGLADSADGLWGGWDKARRLAIMKDSHIGTYGVMALVLVTLARWFALAVLIAAGDWAAIIAAGVISRVPMAAIMAALPNARESGLSHRAGRPPQGAVTTACLLAALAGAALMGTTLLPAVLAVTVLCGWLALTARARLGGQTGDILGASQQLAEIGVLVVASAHLAH
jgi:adenosylcobinamide-GDP ribazoletransferase